MRITARRHVLPFRPSLNATFARYVHSRVVSKRRSLYDVLDVPHSATQAEIKAAYYELSMKYHPDVNKSQEAQNMFTGLYKCPVVLGEGEWGWGAAGGGGGGVGVKEHSYNIKLDASIELKLRHPPLCTTPGYMAFWRLACSNSCHAGRKLGSNALP